ncbi:zinc dependent phospholipase C family protein [Candidatus Xianfuyuplasma coldseepsis]|uniref:Phospholipase C/D domain-containing protein n=1 Tax=Candidatus Xianfuyuplasma coldseepsis TaxID=2782163 RepID=A0A7L7KTD9_9MOLU|nr:zinc dependent phospholipase C family protein [Xianfuyuplasma coldseepsis]QMS85875.1 hypothetical protein G4Z02_08985 [Xianfuyuplasma coldseepsis]
MADVYMHSRLTEDVMKQLETTNVDRQIAFLGAQNSDPMYYATWHKSAKEYRMYADRMHDTDTQGLMIHMTEYVKKHYTKEAYSFLFGYICHYALDVKIHPYVYHRVGVYKRTKPETYQYRGLHLKFERSIDALLMEQEQNKSSRWMNVTRYYFPLKRPPQEVLELMKSTLKHQFDIDYGDRVYQQSVQYMYRVLKYMVTDRFGIKKQLYKFIDLFNKKADLFMADLSLFHHVEDYDFHNKNHATWYHPVTNEPSTKDVYQLYDEAVEFAVTCIQQVNQYLTGQEIDLKMVFTNLSLNSGIDCDRSYPFQYFQSYRPKNNS